MVSITSLKIFKHYKLKPSFSIIKDEKAKDRAGVVWGTSPHPQILADQLILIWPNFYISSNFIWTSFIQIINLIHLDLFQYWSFLIQFEPIWSNLIWFDPIWTNFIWFEPNYQSEAIWTNSSDLNFQKWATNKQQTWQMTRSLSKLA